MLFQQCDQLHHWLGQAESHSPELKREIHNKQYLVMTSQLFHYPGANPSEQRAPFLQLILIIIVPT